MKHTYKLEITYPGTVTDHQVQVVVKSDYISAKFETKGLADALKKATARILKEEDEA